MRIETRSKELSTLQAERHKNPLQPPEFFRDPTPNLDRDRTYTLASPFTVDGMASFENKPMTIRVSPWSSRSAEEQQLLGNHPGFRYNGEMLPLKTEHARKGAHNIQLGEIKIIEHVLAFLLALGIEADFEVSLPSFPTYDHCNRPFLDAAKPLLRPTGKPKFFTVKRPFAGIFENGGYFVLEPDDGERRFLMDHQVSYPGESVGNQRIIAEITPEFFAYICDARTTSFRNDTRRIYWLARLGIARWFYPVTTRNILFADAQKLYNPRSKFDANGTNYEFICHELMDVMAWLKFVEAKYNGRFAGKLTTFLFDHHRQVDAAQYVCENPEFEKKIGITAA